MSDSILVAYASRYGFTQEVAERVAETLRQSGRTGGVVSALVQAGGCGNEQSRPRPRT